MWVELGHGPWSWKYLYETESRMVRAYIYRIDDISRHILDLRCLFDRRIRKAWFRAVRWEIRNLALSIVGRAL